MYVEDDRNSSSKVYVGSSILKTYEVRGTELLLVRSADPADRRCDRQIRHTGDIQVCALFFAGTVSSKGALGLLLKY